MNRNEFEDRERRWNQANPQQEGGRFFGGQQGNYGQQGYGQPDRFGQQGTDRTYSMQAGYDDARRGFDEGYRGQSDRQSAYAPEGDWAGAGNRGGWEQQRGIAQQERFSGQDYGQQRGYGYEGQRGGYDYADRSRFQGGPNREERFRQQGYGQPQQFSGQGYGQPGGYSQRGMDRGGPATEYGTPSGFGMEGWGQQAYRGSDYSNDFSFGSGGQEWREGNRRSQGYPGTDYFSAQGPSGVTQENPWGERSMRGARTSMSGSTAQWQGPHAGKGPRGYQRADDRIREDVCEMLSHHGDIDAGEIDIDVRGGEVTLKGTVEDRWQKRIAEDLVERCSGVKDVRNELRVSQSQAGRESGSFTAQGAAMSAASTGQSTGTTQGAPAATGRANESTTARSR
jgi:hypothetical protein